MKNIFCRLIPFFGLLCLLGASASGQLLTFSEAQRVGLVRQWYGQVQMNAAQAKVKFALLDRGTLFVSTDLGQIQAFDAEKGTVLWTIQVGRRDLPTLEMDASDYYLATINGTSAYVYNRYNGKLLWMVELEDAPGAGPAISQSRLYIPGLKGRVQAYPLQMVEDSIKEMGRDETKLSQEERETLNRERRENIHISNEVKDPLNVQALGRIFVQPVITREDIDSNVDYIAWPTDNGDLNVASMYTPPSSDRFSIKYTVGTGKDISSKPCVVEYDKDDRKQETGRIYVASRDGYVYCVREMDGDKQWSYPCAEPIIEQIAVIITESIDKSNKRLVDRRIYVPTFISGMYSLDALTGEKNWWTPGIKKFLAQGNKRLYGVDHQNNLTVIDLQNGQQIARTPLKNNTIQYVNEITDRIYLISDTGLVQCLRPNDQEKPLYHKQNPEGKIKRQIVSDEDPNEEKNQNESGEAAEGEGVDLFGEDSNDSEQGDDVFGDEADNASEDDPAMDSADKSEDDTFGLDDSDDAEAMDDAAGNTDDAEAMDDAAGNTDDAAAGENNAADDDNPFGGDDVF